MSVVNNNKVAMTTDENKSAAKSPKDDFKDVSFIQMVRIIFILKAITFQDIL